MRSRTTFSLTNLCTPLSVSVSAHTLPPHNGQDLGLLWTGSIASPQPIPPGRPAHFDTALCTLQLSDSPAVFLASVTFHAHLLARLYPRLRSRGGFACSCSCCLLLLLVAYYVLSGEW